MKLEGSCHCGKVRFSLESHTPHPFNRCYCSICRKTNGGGGFAINIMGLYETLKVSGEKHLKIYRAMKDGRPSAAQRHFCGECGSHLFIWGENYPEWVYPLASAIDTPLPEPPELVHLMLGSKAPWVSVQRLSDRDREFDGYPDSSIAGWHREHGLEVD